MGKNTNKQWDLAVIGAGASGMMAAITAARANKKVCIIEKLDKAGKKILATGNGKCNFTNEVMADRFSNVMWLLEQILWKRFDHRLAGFLLEESALEGSPVLKLTHEAIGSHLGNAREVVTRMLRYFQSEGLVKLSRGTVEITNQAGLEVLRDS